MSVGALHPHLLRHRDQPLRAAPRAGSAAVERGCYSPVLAYILFHARVAELVDAGPWHRAF